jgi:hypothetical protein
MKSKEEELEIAQIKHKNEVDKIHLKHAALEIIQAKLSFAIRTAPDLAVYCGDDTYYKGVAIRRDVSSYDTNTRALSLEGFVAVLDAFPPLPGKCISSCTYRNVNKEVSMKVDIHNSVGEPNGRLAVAYVANVGELGEIALSIDVNTRTCAAMLSDSSRRLASWETDTRSPAIKRGTPVHSVSFAYEELQRSLGRKLEKLDILSFAGGYLRLGNEELVQAFLDIARSATEKKETADG